MSREPEPEECDATKFKSINAARNKKILIDLIRVLIVLRVNYPF